MEKAGIITDAAAKRLERMLDVSAARQRVAATNLSNSSTDGYEPKKIEFSDELAHASGRVNLQRTHAGHLSSSQAAADRDYVEVVDEDALENYDTQLERTIAELADAELAYTTAAKLMSKRHEALKIAISGRF